VQAGGMKNGEKKASDRKAEAHRGVRVRYRQ
jgi:hypothetical protein